MNSYFATFPAGAYGIIAKHLKSYNISDLKIIGNDESSVTFESKFSVEKLIELRFFTNIFVVVKDIGARYFITGGYYSLRCIDGGAPVELDARTRTTKQTFIEKELGLHAHTHKARNHFYVIRRTGGKELFGLQLPKPAFKSEKLQKGELKPQLAHILCLAGGVKAKHAVLDPFAGYGAIPLEAVRGFGSKNVLAIDETVLKNRRTHRFINWYHGDATDMDMVASDSIDRIITDPPWGVFDESAGLSELYPKFSKESERVLKPGGVIVILTKIDMQKLLEQNKQLEFVNNWNILVSGKQATIYKIRKQS